jgi:hypothetical protein
MQLPESRVEGQIGSDGEEWYGRTGTPSEEDHDDSDVLLRSPSDVSGEETEDHDRNTIVEEDGVKAEEEANSVRGCRGVVHEDGGTDDRRNGQGHHDVDGLVVLSSNPGGDDASEDGDALE